MNGESHENRDQRIQDLWQTLDTRNEGHLDLHGLRKGLRTIDHPLKNADDLLHDLLQAVDTSGDGRIQYNEFKVWVDHAEKELLQLFQSIDKDNSGGLDKNELRSAFARAGITISNAKLDQFFDEVDVNHDGNITFDEWRWDLILPKSAPLTASNMLQKLSPLPSRRPIQSQGRTQLLYCYGKCESGRRCHHQ